MAKNWLPIFLFGFLFLVLTSFANAGVVNFNNRPTWWYPLNGSGADYANLTTQGNDTLLLMSGTNFNWAGNHSSINYPLNNSLNFTASALTFLRSPVTQNYAITAGQDFCVSFWWKFTGTSGGVVGHRFTGAEEGINLVQHMQWFSSLEGLPLMSTNFVVNNALWQHTVVTRNSTASGQTFAMYQNGSKVNASNASGFDNKFWNQTGFSWLIGDIGQGDFQSTSNVISNVIVWRGSWCDQAAINTLYNLGNGTGNPFSSIDTTPPEIVRSTLNATSCFTNQTDWNASNIMKVRCYDSTPTVVFNITKIGNCSIGTINANYTNMTGNDTNRKCSTTSVLGMSCTLPSTDALNYGMGNISIDCVNTGGYGNASSTALSGPLAVELLSPRPSSVSANVSAIPSGTQVGFNVTWFDDMNLSQYIFSFGIGGTWTNLSAVEMNLFKINTTNITAINGSASDLIANTSQSSDGRMSTCSYYTCTGVGDSANISYSFPTTYNLAYGWVNISWSALRDANGLGSFANVSLWYYNQTGKLMTKLFEVTNNNTIETYNFTLPYNDLATRNNGTMTFMVYSNSNGISGCTLTTEMTRICELNVTATPLNVSMANLTVYNASVNWTIFANDSFGNWNNTGIKTLPSDSCSCPASGDWNIWGADACGIASPCDLSAGSSLFCLGTGTVRVQATILTDSVNQNQSCTFERSSNGRYLIR